jgi:hypothetical protein
MDKVSTLLRFVQGFIMLLKISSIDAIIPLMELLCRFGVIPLSIDDSFHLSLLV